MSSQSDKNCTFLISTEKSATIQQEDICKELENADVSIKIKALKNAISGLLAGETMPRVLMTVIRYDREKCRRVHWGAEEGARQLLSSASGRQHCLQIKLLSSGPSSSPVHTAAGLVSEYKRHFTSHSFFSPPLLTPSDSASRRMTTKLKNCSCSTGKLCPSTAGTGSSFRR